MKKEKSIKWETEGSQASGPRPLARVMARELTVDEVEKISGGGDVTSATPCGADPTDEADRDAHH